MWKVCLVAAAITLPVADAVSAQSANNILPNGYADSPDFKAVAAKELDQGWSWGHCSAEAAIENARAACNDLGGRAACEISRIGDIDVSGLSPTELRVAIDHYREAVESAWRQHTRGSGYQIPFTAFAGEAPGWDEFIIGVVNADPDFPCMTDIEGGGQSLHCSGFARGVGSLSPNAPYPVFGEMSFECSNGQDVKGEYVSPEPGRGFACMGTSGGGQVMVVYGSDTQSIGRDRQAFIRVYDSLVAETGLDRELCGWGLLIS